MRLIDKIGEYKMNRSLIKKEFINEYLKAINENNAAIFAGAGLSRASGYVDWKDLLSYVAESIGLDSKKETDLTAVAQYYKNERGSRGIINQLLIDNFTKDCKENENIKLFSKLPISTYWTTNYDSLIETQLKKEGKIVDVKFRQENLSITHPERDVVVYKMHGDISLPGEAVLTKDDYEAYSITHPLFITALQGDLVTKTFLFIGFSFEDPNLNSILARIRVLLNDNQRMHYCIMKKVSRTDFKTKSEYIYAKTKQELRINDLLRYSISTVLVDDYEEITNILHEIYYKYLIKRVFISGSAHTYGEWQKPEEFLILLANTLIKNDYNITTGLGNQIGQFITSGALEEIMNNKNMKVDRYLTIRPKPAFDLSTKTGKELQEKYHRSMIENSGIVIFLFGNKLDNSNNIINSTGVIKEFDMACEENKFVIPVGSTGFASREIANYITSNIDKFKYLKNYIQTLNSEKDNIKIINTIIELMNELMMYDNESNLFVSYN